MFTRNWPRRSGSRLTYLALFLDSALLGRAGAGLATCPFVMLKHDLLVKARLACGGRLRAETEDLSVAEADDHPPLGVYGDGPANGLRRQGT
jgi:hypothetical protein